MTTKVAPKKSGQAIAAEKRRNAAKEQRQQEAYRLFNSEEKNLREIAEILDCSHETVRLDLRAMDRRLLDEFTEDIRAIKAKQIRELWRQYNRFDKLAANSKLDVLSRVRAGNTCLNVLKEMNDVLGIKAAQKHVHTGENGGPIKTQTSYDLSNLSDEELLALKNIQSKINAA